MACVWHTPLQRCELAVARYIVRAHRLGSRVDLRKEFRNALCCIWRESLILEELKGMSIAK
jgi:hypothetical protein